MSTELIEKLQQGALVTVFAMGIVFAVLIVLMGIIMFQTYVLRERRNISQENINKSSAAPASANINNEQTETVYRVEEVSNDEEIAAAIVAAICAYTNSSSSDFVIKSIKRVNDSVPAWRRSGII